MKPKSSHRATAATLPVQVAHTFQIDPPGKPLFVTSFPMSIDLQAINTDELKSRVGELRRYL